MTTQNLRIAATLALNAVEEHLVGSYIDWHDVARVLREALDEGGDSMLKLCRTCKYDWDGHCIEGNDY